MNHNRFRGFTLIEIIVALGIIGLLIALIIPAILYAREASRRLSCINNLRQMGIAINSYIATYNAFPASITRHSPQSRLLAFTEQVNLYNSINFLNDEGPSLDKPNYTAGTTNISLFICPSDGVASLFKGGNSYGANDGVGEAKPGPFSYRRSLKYISPRDLTDGASHTAAMSEWLVGVSPPRRDQLRSVFRTAFHSGPNSLDAFTSDCVTLNFTTASLGGVIKGNNWLSLEYGLCLYNHTLSPNERSCTNGSLTISGAWTASSLHGQGVNVVFADGHTIFIPSNIALPVWRAIGTMNAGDNPSDY